MKALAAWARDWWTTIRRGSVLTKAGRDLRRAQHDPVDNVHFVSVDDEEWAEAWSDSQPSPDRPACKWGADFPQIAEGAKERCLAFCVAANKAGGMAWPYQCAEGHWRVASVA